MNENDQSLIEKTREFRDEQENEIELEKQAIMAQNGEEEMPQIEIGKISYYPQFKVPSKMGGDITLNDVFVEERTVNGNLEKRLYANGELQITEEDGEITVHNQSLAALIDLSALSTEDDLESVMEKLEDLNEEELAVVSEQVENEEVLELIEKVQEKDNDQEIDEAAEIAEESDSKEELESKLDLGIIPDKSVTLRPEDIKDIPELKGGKKIEYTYSRKMNSWIVLKDGEMAMGPARTTTETMYSVDEYGNKEIKTESPHATIKSKDPTKKIAFSYGQYGEMKADKVIVNRDGTQVKRKIDAKGTKNFDKETKLDMDHIDETEQIARNVRANEENSYGEDGEFDFDRVNDDFNLETEVKLKGYGTVTLKRAMEILRLNRAEEFLKKVEEAPGKTLEDKVQEVIDEIEQEFENPGGRNR